ncbi:MAG: DciA family protein [Sphingopyxis sp.]
MAKPPLTPAAKGVRKAAPKPARRERARGGEARAIADLVPAIGDTAFRKFGFVQSAIVTRWSEIVGARLARVTSPVGLRFPHGKKSDGTLHISVAGAHAVVISHVLPDIIERTNRFFGYAAVAQVRLSQGQGARAVPAPIARETHSATPVEQNASVRAIKDPELRAVLEGLAQSLANRDAMPRVR